MERSKDASNELYVPMGRLKIELGNFTLILFKYIYAWANTHCQRLPGKSRFEKVSKT